MIDMKYRNRTLYVCSLAIASLLIAMLVSGCTSNYYLSANQLLLRKNYVGAIENYDEYILRTKDGAMKTKAANSRSETYYQMGTEAMSRDNLKLAIRLFYLANTLLADTKMVECYLDIAENARQEDDLNMVLQIYDYLVHTYQNLPIIPEVVFRRLNHYHTYEKSGEKVWSNYLLLVDKYNDEEHITKAKPIIDIYMPSFIEEAVELKNSVGHNGAIEKLKMIKDYPSSYYETIDKNIGNLFFELAESDKEEREFFKAHEHYIKAKDYNHQLETKVDERLNEMVHQMVAFGNNLLQQRKIDEAKQLFERTFQIIPNNGLVKEAIAKAEQLEENIRVGDELFKQALIREQEKNYQGALQLYRQSYGRDRLSKTSEKIFLMTNMIEIENDPIAFAKTIITEYDNGIIVRNIDSLLSKLKKEHGDDVRTSGWRIMLSTGTNRYEVRYDITSRADSYFLVWHVNLLNRTINPLNNHSKEVMGG